MSFTFPNSLLYSGEIKSINFSNPLLNISRITTKKQTTIIVIMYVLEIPNKMEVKIITEPIMSCIFIFRSLDTPLNKPRVAQNALSLKVVLVMLHEFELIVYKNYGDAPDDLKSHRAFVKICLQIRMPPPRFENGRRKGNN